MPISRGRLYRGQATTGGALYLTTTAAYIYMSYPTTVTSVSTTKANTSYNTIYGTPNYVTSSPTQAPSQSPTLRPSITPTQSPSIIPSSLPTTDPTTKPTALPSMVRHSHSCNGRFGDEGSPPPDTDGVRSMCVNHAEVSRLLGHWSAFRNPAHSLE